MPCRILLLALVLAFCLTSGEAQLRVAPVGERPDSAAFELMLRKLSSTGTFMQTDAHPDDEDNALLAMLGEGQGMRTTLVSATRGDGGQNEIGPELFQALGVLRTEELLAVHRFDGAEQYFTRAVDFGFSFSIDESIEKWGHDEIVGDYVRHIRTIRPDVVVGFLCGGGGGGQHHQASTRLTLEAFRDAADPSRYPEQIREGLRPWQAKRVFCTEGFGAQGQPTPNLVSALQAIAAAVEQAKQAAETRGPTAATVPLARGLASLRSLRAAVAEQGTSNSALQLSPDARYEIDFRLAQKEPQFEE